MRPMSFATGVPATHQSGLNPNSLRVHEDRFGNQILASIQMVGTRTMVPNSIDVRSSAQIHCNDGQP